MAHFRRRVPATRRHGRPFDSWKAKGEEKAGRHTGSWLSTWPAWHDVLHHRRPMRRAESALARDVLLDRVDPEDTAWPVHKKPHVYYW